MRIDGQDWQGNAWIFAATNQVRVQHGSSSPQRLRQHAAWRPSQVVGEWDGQWPAMRFDAEANGDDSGLSNRLGAPVRAWFYSGPPAGESDQHGRGAANGRATAAARRQATQRGGRRQPLGRDRRLGGTGKRRTDVGQQPRLSGGTSGWRRTGFGRGGIGTLGQGDPLGGGRIAYFARFPAGNAFLLLHARKKNK